MNYWEFLQGTWLYMLILYVAVVLIDLEWRLGVLRKLWNRLYTDKKWEKIVKAYEENLEIEGFREKADEFAQAYPELSEMEIIKKAKKESTKKC